MVGDGLGRRLAEGELVRRGRRTYNGDSPVFQGKRLGSFGPGAREKINAMSLKVANIRLELDEPEEALPGKVAAKLGRGAAGLGQVRILRKSLDARRHDDLHFIYAAEVELRGG